MRDKRPKCEQGHNLDKKSKVSGGSFLCAGCKTTISQGSELSHCHECNIGYCRDCVEKKGCFAYRT